MTRLLTFVPVQFWMYFRTSIEIDFDTGACALLLPSSLLCYTIPSYDYKGAVAKQVAKRRTELGRYKAGTEGALDDAYYEENARGAFRVAC
jgi:hypothetical protein